MTDEEFGVTDAMIAHGGSFVQALGHLWRLADAENRARLCAAFPEYWARYRAIALQSV